MRVSHYAKKIPIFRQENRSPELFRELTDRHVTFLYNLALKYTGNRYDAEDIVQETLLTAYKNFAQLRDERKFKSWAFSILRNTYLKSLKKNEPMNLDDFNEDSSYVKVLEETSGVLDLEKIYEQKVESEKIQKILDKLPEKYKSPLLLYYMEDMSYQEIASTQDIPIGTVMSRLARGKQILKKALLRGNMQESRQTEVVDFNRFIKKGI